MRDVTVLVVEDNDVLREGVQILLETDGFDVLTASNGVDALGKMELKSPNLILSDISMPELDGYGFFEAVRSRPEWVAIPFIFLTARGERDEVFAGRKLGVEDYLVKPVNRHELLTTIRSRLARSQQLMLAQMQQAYEMSLIVLANAIELRDTYTRGHVERVRDYALILAERMGWSSSSIRALQLGSILHDIGKIHISESILCKAGPLTEQEWDEMKKHPLVGVELVKNIPYLVPAIPVIRHHHERWDGRGYPDALAGEDIPLSARIVAVADSLDAMTSKRVYQKACSPEEAYHRIIGGCRCQYDPTVVAAFESAWVSIRERMQIPSVRLVEKNSPLFPVLEHEFD